MLTCITKALKSWRFCSFAPGWAFLPSTFILWILWSLYIHQCSLNLSWDKDTWQRKLDSSTSPGLSSGHFLKSQCGLGWLELALWITLYVKWENWPYIHQTHSPQTLASFFSYTPHHSNSTTSCLVKLITLLLLWLLVNKCTYIKSCSKSKAFCI